MNARDLRTTLAGAKLLIFTIISVIVTGTLASIMGNFSSGDQHEYRAVFTSASSLEEGDDVRIAGVTVGEVSGIDVTDGNQATVSFRVEDDIAMTSASGAQVRYLDLVGGRYMALTQGRPGAPALQPGQALPASQTTPAIDLTELFNGFQPLFEALTPEDVNKLSLNIVQVLQGEGGTVASLLAETSSLTNTLADRDQLIGEVITNLSTTMQTIDSHHTEVGQLLTGLNGWMKDLDKDRHAIGASLENMAGLSDKLAGLLSDVRPYTKADLAELKRVATVLNRPDNQKMLAETLHRLPKTLESQARIGTYGSWYNYYLCDLNLSIKLPSLGKVLDESPAIKGIQNVLDNVSVYSRAERCDV